MGRWTLFALRTNVRAYVDCWSDARQQEMNGQAGDRPTLPTPLTAHQSSTALATYAGNLRPTYVNKGLPFDELSKAANEGNW